MLLLGTFELAQSDSSLRDNIVRLYEIPKKVVTSFFYCFFLATGKCM